MKRILLLLVLPGWCIMTAFGQNGSPSTPGARGLAMGGTGLTHTDVHALWANPAGLADLPESWSAAVFGQQAFLLADIRQLSAVAATRLGEERGVLGMSLGYYGFESYNEQRIGLAYSRRLFSRLSLGLQLLALNTSIPAYGSKLVGTFELGLLAEVSPQLNIGCRLFSPARVAVLEGEYLPSILSIGLGYRPAQQLLIQAEIEKDILFPARFRLGADYQLVPALSIRLGVATQPVLLSLGAGIQLADKIRLDVGASYHQILGVTPGLSLVFQ